MEQISADLKSEFPDEGGFSVTNLRYCKLFYNYFTIHQQVVDELKQLKNEESIIHPQVIDESDLLPQIQNLPQVVTKIPWEPGQTH